MPRPLRPLSIILVVAGTASVAGASPTSAQRCQAGVELASAKSSQCRMRAEAAFATTRDSTRRDVVLGRCEGRRSPAIATSVAKQTRREGLCRLC